MRGGHRRPVCRASRTQQVQLRPASGGSCANVCGGASLGARGGANQVLQQRVYAGRRPSLRSRAIPRRGELCLKTGLAPPPPKNKRRSIHPTVSPPRDRAALLAIYEHKVLLTEQLKTLFFRSLRRAQDRLRELAQLDLIERRHPPQERGKGKSPGYWFLRDPGARIASRPGPRRSAAGRGPQRCLRSARGSAAWLATVVPRN